MTDEPSRKPINPAALSLPDAAKLLTKVGGQPITEALLRADVSAGAPANADGTLNLVRYAAWLVREMNRSGEEAHGQ